MSDQPAAPGHDVESDEALFDIVVQLAAGSSIERVKDKAVNELGMEPLKVEALAKALQSGPSARIGSAVPKTRAEKARDDFTRAGLKVTLSPVLSISKMTAAESDGKTMCPACDVRVILPENRQCPNCNVFVDKVDEQFLLRKKLMEQERRRAEMTLDKEKRDSEKKKKEAAEREMRELIRKEIEAEMGIGDGKGGGSLAGKLKMWPFSVVAWSAQAAVLVVRTVVAKRLRVHRTRFLHLRNPWQGAWPKAVIWIRSCKTCPRQVRLTLPVPNY
jgi:uncharacterized Zn finger protein (UPF0148 family)